MVNNTQDYFSKLTIIKSQKCIKNFQIENKLVKKNYCIKTCIQAWLKFNSIVIYSQYVQIINKIVMHQIFPTQAPKPYILNFKSSPIKHQQTICQQQLFQTPQKKPLSENSERLRSEIRDRLLSKKSQTVLNQFEYQEKQKMGENEEKDNLREMVIELQSEDNEGYYMYKDWVNLNQYLFKDVEEKFRQNLWKIMRLINFGEVAIPSGLIYDVIAELNNRKHSIKKLQSNIIAIINQFLQDNDIQNSYQSFKQLQYYIPLSKIIKGYRLEKQQIQPPNRSTNKEVFQNLYNDSKIRKQKLAMKTLTTQKKVTEGCTFVPLIKQYKTDSKSLNRFHRYNCESVTKHIFETDREVTQDELFTHQFKARPIDQRIYKAKLQNIKGLKQHVNRNVDSYMDKLRLKRSMQKPVILKRT